MKRALMVFAIILLIPFLVNAQATSELNEEDQRHVEFFKKHGILEEGLNFDGMSHDIQKKFLETLIVQTGVDDIDFIESKDERFSTPEKTWDLYKASFLSGDMDLCNKCLMPAFQKKHETTVIILGHDGMVRMIEEMSPIQKITEKDLKAKYRIRHEINGNEITFYIYFKNVFGKWRIIQY